MAITQLAEMYWSVKVNPHPHTLNPRSPVRCPSSAPNT